MVLDSEERETEHCALPGPHSKTDPENRAQVIQP